MHSSGENLCIVLVISTTAVNKIKISLKIRQEQWIDQYTLLIISCLVLIMKKVSDEHCRENQNTQIMFNIFFIYILLLMIYVKKYGTARQTTVTI
jgi:hypothetical protein